MTNSYSEDILIEQPTIALFETLGWDTASCYHETFGPSGTMGRAASTDVVLRPRLLKALQALNPQLLPEALNLAIAELTRDRTLMTPVQAKAFLVTKLREKIAETEEFFSLRGICLHAMHAASGFDLVKLLDEAVEAILVSDESKRTFLALAGLVTRLDYLERFQQLIADYNSGAYNVEAMFAELMRFAEALNTEERRHMNENLTEEELALFDLLTKPEMELTDKDREQVKQGAKSMLERLKREKLVIDWRKREQARAAVRQMIEIALDEFLPTPYTKQIFDLKCDRVYQHIYDAYAGQGRSVYTTTH